MEKSEEEEDLLIISLSGVLSYARFILCFLEPRCCLYVPEFMNFFEQISQ